MKEDMDARWRELEEHPAWLQLVGLLQEQRKLAVQRMLALSLMSNDPAIRAVGHEIQKLTDILNLPEEERTRGQDDGRVSSPPAVGEPD